MSKQVFKLYNGEVELTYDPDARYRYSVDGTPIRGVTTVIGNVLDKAGLRLWPLNELSKLLFGMKWDDVTKQYLYTTQGLIKPQKPYSELELNNLFQQGYNKHKEKRDKAADTGSLVHEAIEQFMAGEAPVPEKLEVLKPFKNFVKWYEDGGWSVEWSERPIYSRKHKFAGRPDALLVQNGKNILTDFKTTEPSPSGIRIGKQYTGIYPEMLLQLGAYSLAYREEMQIQQIIDVASKIDPASFDTPKVEDLVDDLQIVNVSKGGQIAVLKASELGLTVEDCEQAFLMGVELHNFLAKIKKVKVGMPLPEGEDDEK